MDNRVNHYTPPDLEVLLNDADTEWLQELEESLNIGAGSQPCNEMLREMGFWSLKDSINGDDVMDMHDALRTKSDFPLIPRGPVGEVTAVREKPHGIAQNAANNITFDIGFRGYDREQVDNYIEALTAEYNKICIRVGELEKQNENIRVNAEAAGRAIVRAEQVAFEIVAEAEKEADRIVQRADFRTYSVAQ